MKRLAIVFGGMMLAVSGSALAGPSTTASVAGFGILSSGMAAWGAHQTHELRESIVTPLSPGADGFAVINTYYRNGADIVTCEVAKAKFDKEYNRKEIKGHLTSKYEGGQCVYRTRYQLDRGFWRDLLGVKYEVKEVAAYPASTLSQTLRARYNNDKLKILGLAVRGSGSHPSILVSYTAE